MSEEGFYFIIQVFEHDVSESMIDQIINLEQPNCMSV